jgi:hypothetical protein
MTKAALSQPQGGFFHSETSLPFAMIQAALMATGKLRKPPGVISRDSERLHMGQAIFWRDPRLATSLLPIRGIE